MRNADLSVMFVNWQSVRMRTKRKGKETRLLEKYTTKLFYISFIVRLPHYQ